MTISRTTEIKSSSKVSFDDAMKKGIARALKTLNNVRGASIENQEVLLDEIRQGRAGLHLDQHRRKSALGIEQQGLRLATGKAHFLPWKILRAHVMRALIIEWLGVVRLRVYVHQRPPPWGVSAMIH